MMTHPDEVTELFSMLEFCERQVVDEIKHLIQENLNSVRDPWLLNGLVDYYMATKSKRCLQVLISVREPHDKHLFDKMAECLKNSNRPQALTLLGYLVRQQPSWLHKIVHHRAMHTLMHVMKTEQDVPCLMDAVLSLVVLLPIVPASVGPFLPDIFEVFSRLASWDARKRAGAAEVHLLHLRTGAYALFHRLYAMYPCNFLAYLRQYYGGHDRGRENLRAFAETVRPMLERVRLHPLLVTASKEMELNPNRWKRMETHDIVVECAKLSLDDAEGTREDRPSGPVGLGDAIVLPSRSPCDQSRNLLARNHPSATPVESVLAAADSLSPGTSTPRSESTAPGIDRTFTSVFWSPSDVCGLNTPPTRPHSPDISDSDVGSDSREKDAASHAGSSPPLDLAVEAIQESICMPTKDFSETMATSVRLVPNYNSTAMLPDVDGEQKLAVDSRPTDATRRDSLETSTLSSEQDSADREVSAIVANIPSDSIESKGHDLRQATPFLSTTHNLTAGLERPSETNGTDIHMELAKLDDLEDSCKDEGNDRELHLEFVRSMARIRYRSQCVVLPDPSIEVQTKGGLRRLNSCPNIHCKDSTAYAIHWEISATEQMNHNSQACGASLSKSVGKKVAAAASNNDCTSVCKKTALNSFSTVISNAHSIECPSAVKPSPETFYPYAFSPFNTETSGIRSGSAQSSDVVCDLTRTNASLASNATIPVTQTGAALLPNIPYFSTLSPHEILDRHLQLGNEVYLQELNSVPLTSSKDTDWTHFGGQPPADEIKILRGQISLLHSQMLFERYRREVHAQRNRRLLGKAKSIRALEEHSWAMQDQLILQEKIIQDLNEALCLLQKKLSSAQQQRQQVETNLQDEVRHCIQQIEAMKLLKDKLEYSLRDLTDKNGFLCKELQKAQAKLFEMGIDLQSAAEGVLQQQTLEKSVTFLQRKATLLGEMLQLYRDRADAAPLPMQLEEEMHIFNQASEADLANLKQSLDAKTTQLEACKAKVAELETSLASKDLAIAEQKQQLETMKACHDDQMACKEKQYNSLLNICRLAESHIMELHHQLDERTLPKASVPSATRKLHVQVSRVVQKDECKLASYTSDLDGSSSKQQDDSTDKETRGAICSRDIKENGMQMPSYNLDNQMGNSLEHKSTLPVTTVFMQETENLDLPAAPSDVSLTYAKR